MGVLFQDGALFGSLNVYDNTAFPLRKHTDKARARFARSSCSGSPRSPWLDRAEAAEQDLRRQAQAGRVSPARW
jgi:ABC-type Fe3+/spermidine/putrescine transport system ATPase subunit